jgi:hypothetical protein
MTETAAAPEAAPAPTTATVGEAAPASAPAPAAVPAPTLAEGGNGQDGGTGGAPAAPAPAPLVAAAPASAPPVAAPIDPPAADPDLGDWRAQLAGGDAEFMKRLERYASPAEFGKAHRSLQTKMSSGQVKSVLPPNATAEEVAAYRKENGVPDVPEGYQVPNAEGIDPSVIGMFRDLAHKQNWTPDQFHASLNFFQQTQNTVAKMRDEQDQQYQLQVEDELRKEYGNDFRRNMNVLGNFRESMPDGLPSRLLAGRMADGTRIGNDPQFVKWMVQTGLDFYGTGTIVPAGGSDPAKNVNDAIAAIESEWKTPEGYAAYYKDEAKQTRYRDLLEARDKPGFKRVA